ncbi:hypothetical protein J3R03_001859 [Actinoplanes couchii]|uniref:Uncharacterized protein n=1 Tax=Actinoplanes couchii TaxID=403638 RepID=A0ABQ3XHS0_9ACTN|nr:hypothetical protein [Actinoplanes couchii]GID58048.1 hypothetical protein Aco03nite_064520 [Actinoplanes couchii]
MLVHPSVLMDLANDHNRELIAEADRDRLLALVRCVRRRRKVRKEPDRGEKSGEKRAERRGQPAGTLASCEQSVVVPVR